MREPPHRPQHRMPPAPHADPVAASVSNDETAKRHRLRNVALA
jgi:hypothetical protein